MSKNVKFIIKPEEKMVIAKKNREDCITVEEEVKKHCSELVQTVIRRILLSKYSQDIDYVTAPFTGIAKCDDVDIFDENIGKEIACSKVDYKYHIAMEKKFANLENNLTKTIGEIKFLRNLHAVKAGHIQADLERHYCNRGNQKCK